jgi:beta-fructofuranosidase
MYVWDFWFLKEGDTWHAFHLQSPALKDVSDPHLVAGHPNVGHATSTDLLNWTNRGPVLAPIRGTWNDIMIATGSAVAYDGRYWMVFTGRGTPEGVGLAVSDDLTIWTKVGDGPVFEFSQIFEGVWRGETVRWKALADPFIYPEPIDGWFYMVINAQVQGVPAGESGCLPMLRSKDLKTWEAHAAALDASGPLVSLYRWRECERIFHALQRALPRVGEGGRSVQNRPILPIRQ